MDHVHVSTATLDELESLYQRRYADFLRVAAAIVGNIEAARDVVHDAFVACVRSREKYRGEGSLEAWVWRAVVNSARKWWRSPHDAVSFVGVDLPDELQAHRLASDEFDEVRAAIRLLPERQRLVLFLRYYADLDYEAIAEALKIRPGTVGAALNAAHAAMRRHLPEVTNA